MVVANTTSSRSTSNSTNGSTFPLSDQHLDTIVKTFQDFQASAVSFYDQQLADAIKFVLALSTQIKTALDEPRHCGEAQLQGKAQVVSGTVKDKLIILVKRQQARAVASSSSKPVKVPRRLHLQTR